MELAGKLIVAMPAMGDPRFERSVILICAHSDDGAMGLIVNKPVPDFSFAELLVQLKIAVTKRGRDIRVHFGGPVERGRGFVLHSPDFHLESATLPIDGGVSLTATLDILRAMASGLGPQKAVLALGYAGWASGQLEDEILSNGWLTCPADEALLFDGDLASKYDRALRKLGVEPAMLVGDAGHA